MQLLWVLHIWLDLDLFTFLVVCEPINAKFLDFLWVGFALEVFADNAGVSRQLHTVLQFLSLYQLLLFGFSVDYIADITAHFHS